MIGCVRKLNTKKFKSRFITCGNFKNYLPLKLIEELIKIDWFCVTNSLNVNDAWICMKNILLNAFNLQALKLIKKVKGQQAPWLTSKIKELMNKRDKLLRKSQRTKSDDDIAKYKQKRNEVNTNVRRAKSSHHINLLQEYSGSSNKFWKTLKSIYPTITNVMNQPQSFEVNGKQLSEKHVIANAFTLSTGVFPTECKCAKIMPVYKSRTLKCFEITDGSPYDPVISKGNRKNSV